MPALTKAAPFDYVVEYLALDSPRVGTAMGTVYSPDADAALDDVEELYAKATVQLKSVKVTAKIYAVGDTGASITRWIQPQPGMVIPPAKRPPALPPPKKPEPPVDILAKVKGLTVFESLWYQPEVRPYLVHTKEQDDAEEDIKGPEDGGEGGESE